MMGELVRGDTITTAWVRAMERLVASGNEAFDLLVVTQHPDQGNRTCPGVGDWVG